MSHRKTGSNSVCIELRVRVAGTEATINFDGRPLEKQVEDILEEHGGEAQDDIEYVLTRTIGPELAVLTCTSQLHLLPAGAQVVLEPAGSLVQARVDAMRVSTQSQLKVALRNLLAITSARQVLAEQLVNCGGIRVILQACYQHAGVTEIGMACIVSILRYADPASSLVEWLQENWDTHGTRLFKCLFDELFPDDSSVQSPDSVSTPYASLGVLLFLLHEVDGSAAAAHEAASGKESGTTLSPPYQRMVAAAGRDECDFWWRAGVLVLQSMVLGAKSLDEDELLPQMQRQMEDFDEDIEDTISEAFQDALLDHAVDSSADLVGGVEAIEAKWLRLELKKANCELQHAKDIAVRLRAELRKRHNQMCKMVSFLRIDSSPVVQQAMESLVSAGWKSVDWRSGYSLLHYVCECENQLDVVDLVATFCTDLADVEHKDGNGQRAIDYARSKNTQAVVKLIEKHRRAHFKEQVAMGNIKQRRRTNAAEEPLTPHPNAESTKFFGQPLPAPKVTRPITAEVPWEPPEVGLEERQKLVIPEGLHPSLRKACESVIKEGWPMMKWKHQYTALHLAASMGSESAVRLLISATAAVGLKVTDEIEHQRPIDVARKRGHEKLMALLDPDTCPELNHPAKLGYAAEKDEEAASCITPRPTAIKQSPRMTNPNVRFEKTRLHLEAIKMRPLENLVNNTPREDTAEVEVPKTISHRALIVVNESMTEDQLKQFSKLLRIYGQDMLFKLIQRPLMCGGLGLDENDAQVVVEHMSVLNRVTASTEAKLGEVQARVGELEQENENLKLRSGRRADLDSEEDIRKRPDLDNEDDVRKLRKELQEALARAEQLEKVSQLPNTENNEGSSEWDASRNSEWEAEPDTDNPNAETNTAKPEVAKPKKGQEKGQAKGQEKGQEKGAGPAKGGGKGKGKAGAPAGVPDGKGGKAGKGGKGAQPDFKKPVLAPTEPMKTINWQRYLMGVHIMPGETIWDLVNDEHASVPADQLEERFSKNAGKMAVVPTESQKRKKPKFLKIVPDDQRQTPEILVRFLPSPSETVQAIMDLNEGIITVEWVKDIKRFLCPNPEQVEQMVFKRAEDPYLPWGSIEEYMWELSRLPAARTRLAVWGFVRAFPESYEMLIDQVTKFERMVTAFRNSKELPHLLGLVLAFGNYLNGGNSRLGQADAFPIETLLMLESVRDPKGKDVRHLILKTYFETFPDRAEALLEEMSPVFDIITRAITQSADEDGGNVVKLVRTVRIQLEEIDNQVSKLQNSLSSSSKELQTALQVIEDPADNFKLSMPEIFKKTEADLAHLSEYRDQVRVKYDALIKYFKAAEWKPPFRFYTKQERNDRKDSQKKAINSMHWCLCWDEFFIPSDLIENKDDKLKKNVLIPRFCRGLPIGVESLQILWELRDPYARKKAQTAGDIMPGGKPAGKTGSGNQPPTPQHRRTVARRRMSSAKPA